MPSSLWNRTKRASSIPLLCDGVVGKQHAFGQARVRRELHFVIRLGQHQDFSRRGLSFLIAGPKVFHGRQDAAAQFLQRERVAQALQRLAAEVARQTQFLKLPIEQAFLVRCIGHLRRLEAVARGRVDRDVAVGVQESRCER